MPLRGLLGTQPEIVRRREIGGVVEEEIRPDRILHAVKLETAQRMNRQTEPLFYDPHRRKYSGGNTKEECIIF